MSDYIIDDFALWQSYENSKQNKYAYKLAYHLNWFILLLDKHMSINVMWQQALSSLIAKEKSKNDKTLLRQILFSLACNYTKKTNIV